MDLKAGNRVETGARLGGKGYADSISVAQLLDENAQEDYKRESSNFGTQTRTPKIGSHFERIVLFVT